MPDSIPSTTDRLTALSDRFEAAWRSGTQPVIEEFLNTVPKTDRSSVLRKLIGIDIVYRRRRGERPNAAEYVARFAEIDPQWLNTSEKDLSTETYFGSQSESGHNTHTASGLGTQTGIPPATDTMPSLPVVPGYEILSVLGRGGMGIVYKARHLRLDRIVALKMIRGPGLNNPNSVRRFCREMQVAASLSHPNIVTIHDAGQEGETPFFTMEFLEGSDLATLVRKNGPLGSKQACDFTRQTALGLQHALERGLIHRDVKPANLFVVSDGRMLKILDLGLARVVQNSAQSVPESETTQEGAMLGTPDYVAPEQLVDAAAVDTRADLYGLGCTLYFMLSGSVPFPGGNASTKIAKHLSPQGPKPVESLRPDVPAKVAAIVRRLMEKAPENRFQSPAELVEALDAAARSAKWFSGRARAAIAVGVVVALAGIGLVVREIRRTPAEAVQLPPSNLPLRIQSPADNETKQPLKEDADRKAARALGSLGFDLVVKSDSGGEFKVKAGDPFPDEPFAVHWIFAEPGVLFDDDFVKNIFLPNVAPLRKLKAIQDYGGRMNWTEDDLDRLADSSASANLTLFQSSIPLTNAAIDALKRFPKLDSLQLRADYAGDALLERLSELNRLTKLRLDRVGKFGKVTERGRKAIAALRVEGLGLFYPAELDRPFADLIGSMPELFDLFIWTNQPLDNIVENIIKNPKLASFAMNDTLTDAGLQKLQTGKQLRILNVAGNPVSEAKLKELADALPACKIYWENGVFEPKSNK